MRSNWRCPIRLGLGWTLFAAASLCAADGPTATAPDPEIIPSRRANKLVVRNVKPDYPAIAKMNYIQGRVSLQTLVDSEGKVKEAHVVKGHPLLAVSALKAILGWTFKPAHARQGPATFQTYVDVTFALQTRQIGNFPEKPEQDLSRQVQPPRVLEKPAGGNGTTCLRLRVLVGEDGHAIDSIATTPTPHGLSNARQAVARWVFRPAHWGAVAIPWYLEVDVPVEDPDAPVTNRAAAALDLQPAADR